MPEFLVRRGPLIFKGSKKKQALAAPVDKSTPKRPAVECKKGEGRIVTFGTTVQGMETRFKDELGIGDLIEIRHPQTLALERRIVTGISSQRCLSVHEPFSTDLVSTTDFTILKDESVTGLKQELHEDQAEEEESSLSKKIASEKSVLTFQDKAGPWNRKTVTLELDRNYSQEELLDMRCKKVHDKYC
jgi:hypothetical protein